MSGINIKSFRSGNEKSIVSQLEQPDFRFILVGKNKKDPLEKGCQNNVNYRYDGPKLLRHLERGGNYGVLCGFGGLIVFDADMVARLEELEVIQKLPCTFSVRTGGGGLHFYYYCRNFMKMVLFDPERKDEKGEYIHLGEIQTKGFYVVGPGSIHPNGNQYKVVNDSPIAEVESDILLDIIKGLRLSKKEKGKPAVFNKEEYRRLGDALRIDDVAWPEGNIQRTGDEIHGTHPTHGSDRSGNNFFINPVKNVWHCFRCNSGGGPLEWIGVKDGLISCADAGPGCLKGGKFKRVVEIAEGLGYKIPDLRRSGNRVKIIDRRVVLDKLPEELPPDQVVVVKGPPRIGKTHWGIEQLLKAGSGIYITHNHSIVTHALRIFEDEGGRSAVHLEGKSRPGMCRKNKINCKECELYPNQHDKNHISYIELKARAEELLREEKILTKDKVPGDLCPYFTLKFAEEFARYCFAVPHFLEDLKTRRLLVLDEDPTLSYFYPTSSMVFRYKKEKHGNKFDNTLGIALERVPEIKERLEAKENRSKEDEALGWAIDTLGGINEIIKTTMSGEGTPEKCCVKIEEQLTNESKVTYDDETIEKALKNLDEYHIDYTTDVDLRDYICTWFHIFKKKPLFMLSAGRSGYRSVHMIGDASSPVIHMGWSSTTIKSGRKILIIGNTLAELFGKALGNAVVIEISAFKYAKNFVVIPVDSSGEDTYDGQVKNQRLKVRKLIKSVNGDPDSETRQSIMVLTGSKRNQDALIRSIGGISHASQEEGEIGQKWNYLAGMVNVFYQNSTISRGLDVDQYNVLLVHDADFAQPYWSAAIESGEDGARDILESIIMDETTNSVLRISPVKGGNENRPKIVIVPRVDLQKIRYLDDQILEGNMPGRTPDINDVATIIRESKLAGTSNLNDDGISSQDELMGPEWENAVREGKLLDKFRSELDRVCSRDKYTEEELVAIERNILSILKKAGNGTWVSVDEMRERGLKCKDSLIRPALRRLYYQGVVKRMEISRRVSWRWNPISLDVLLHIDFEKFGGAA